MILELFSVVVATISLQSDYIKGWLENPEFVALEDNLEGDRHLQLRTGVVPDDGNLIPELISQRNYFSDFEPIKAGHYLIHNWQNAERSNFILDLSGNEHHRVISLNNPISNDGYLIEAFNIISYDENKTVFYAKYSNYDSGLVEIDHDSFYVSLLHDLTDIGDISENFIHQVGDTAFSYLATKTGEIFAFNNKSLEPVNNGENILNDGITQDLVLSGVKLFAGGIRVIGVQYGVDKEFFYDQITQKWTEEPLDSSEIGPSIPLMPAN